MTFSYGLVWADRITRRRKSRSRRHWRKKRCADSLRSSPKKEFVEAGRPAASAGFAERLFLICAVHAFTATTAEMQVSSLRFPILSGRYRIRCQLSAFRDTTGIRFGFDSNVMWASYLDYKLVILSFSPFTSAPLHRKICEKSPRHLRTP